jgi:hypothetical protein
MSPLREVIAAGLPASSEVWRDKPPAKLGRSLARAMSVSAQRWPRTSSQRGQKWQLCGNNPRRTLLGRRLYLPTFPPSAFSGVIYAKAPPCRVDGPVRLFRSGRGASPPPASRSPVARLVRQLLKQISWKTGPSSCAGTLLGERRHECRRPWNRCGGGLVTSRRDHHGTNT